MKIAVVSDSPALTTGFGIVTHQFVDALLDAGHEVRCFGLKDRTDNSARLRYRCPVEPVDVFEPWGNRLRMFVRAVPTDILFIYMDAFCLAEVSGYLANLVDCPPVACLLIFDGLPVSAKYLAGVLGMRTVWVTTPPAREYLAARGVAVDDVIPPGFDPHVFRPLNVADIRRCAGLADRFVVGVFGRNTERKQQPRVLRALELLRRHGQDDGLHVYFHCVRRAYWQLDEIAASLGVEDLISFPNDLTDETDGVPYRSADGPAAGPFDGLGYVERMNMCDLVVNVAHCGDFEQVLIESQACGVPLAATDDGGIMAAAMGEGGLRLRAADVDFWNAGQRCHRVDVEAVAEAIQSVRTNPNLARSLRARGLENAQQYTWAAMRERIVSAFARLG